MISCPQCSTENRDTAHFCSNCAAPLQTSSAHNTCPRCGTHNLAQAKYCHQCAAPLQGSASPPTGTLPPQTLLAGRYLTLEKVGQGGMGAVYKVADTRLSNKLWAVKELSDAAMTNPQDKLQAAQAFTQEAQMLSRLGHPNLPKVVDHFSENGKQYLVMDFVEGETLEEKFTRRNEQPFSEAEVVNWAMQLCDVLDYLHSQQQPIVFRDLKPGNIMIDNQGRVKLIDFGIARLFKPGKAADTSSFGTAGYAPPEQYGKGQTDARSDLYALGATMHQLLTGHDPGLIPFQFEPVRKLNPAVSPDLEQVVMRAVEQAPGRRWQSAGEMRQALEKASYHQPAISKPTMPVGSSVTRQATGSQSAASLPTSTTSQRGTSKGWAWALGLFVLLLVVVVIALQSYTTGPRQGASSTAIQTTETPQAQTRISTPQEPTVATALVEQTATEQSKATATAITRVRKTATAQAKATATARTRATATARARATATARARATATARARATATARARATATARARATATAQRIAATATMAAQQASRVVGPVDRSLEHEEDDYIEVYRADVNLRDFVVEATFFNPYSPSRGDWDCGFLLRYPKVNNQHAIGLDSDGDWFHKAVLDGEWTWVGNGHISKARLEAGQSNTLRVIATGDSGLFFVNDQFVAELDLSDPPRSGDILVAIGIFNGHEINGQVTRIEDLTVWSLESSSKATTKPTTPPKSLPPPTLQNPTSWQSIEDIVTFSWTWKGNLATKHYFEVRIRQRPDTTAEYRGVSQPLKERSITVDLKRLVEDTAGWNTWPEGRVVQGSELWWSVAIVNWNGNSGARSSLLVESELWPFTFSGQPGATRVVCECSEYLCGHCKCGQECCIKCCKKCQ